MKKTRRAKINVKTTKARRVTLAEFEKFNRSRRSLKGWETRRRNLRREAREERERRAKRKTKKKPSPPKKRKRPTEPPPKAPPLRSRDYVVTMSYRDKRGHTRTVDFVSTANSRAEAIEQVQEDHPWTQKIPWRKITVAEGPESNQDAGTVRERLVSVKPSRKSRTSKSKRRSKTKSK